MVKPDGRSGVVFIQTVEDNKKMYMTREVAGANRARKVYEHLLYPGIGDFVNIIRWGWIRNCQLSLDDAKRMFAIYGTHVMRGKGTEVPKTNKYQQYNIVAVPRSLIKSHREVVLFIDMFFVK